MSKDIATGKKATDFADAVKGLLGLNAMYSAIQHFNPRIRSSVISSYESSYNAQSNTKIKEYTDTIERCKTEIAAIDARIEELDNEIESARARKAEKTEEIKQYAEGEELQEKKEKLLGKIRTAERSKSNVYKLISKDFNGTAQSISVIFAFITGIIKMARDNRNATDEDAQLLSSEPYPLVMDAPLSAFDKRRIKTVCQALPETAEQVIIFIKDTDGELAEEHIISTSISVY